jgi:predicted amidohydrolase
VEYSNNSAEGGQLKIALVQMTCEKGDITRNVRRTIEFSAQAADAGADIVCFPEASMTGYIDPPGGHPEAVVFWDDARLTPLYQWSRPNQITIVAGIVERNPDGLPYLSQGIIRQGKLEGVYHKSYIAPDEVSLFSAGNELCLFSHRDDKIGLSVCADIESEDLFRRYSEAGARIVLHSSAPGLYGDQATRNWQSGYDWWRGDCQSKLGKYAHTYGLTIAAATQSGRTVDEDFPGGGYLFDPSGALVAETDDWSEGILIADIT